MDANQPKERRILTRIPGNTIEPVRLRFDGGEIIGRVQDISLEGISILTTLCLEPGTWLVLEPAEPRRRLSPELKAEVRHTELCGNEEYLVGCRFSRLLMLDDVMALGASTGN